MKTKNLLISIEINKNIGKPDALYMESKGFLKKRRILKK